MMWWRDIHKNNLTSWPFPNITPGFKSFSIFLHNIAAKWQAGQSNCRVIFLGVVAPKSLVSHYKNLNQQDFHNTGRFPNQVVILNKDDESWVF